MQSQRGVDSYRIISANWDLPAPCDFSWLASYKEEKVRITPPSRYAVLSIALYIASLIPSACLIICRY